MNKNKIIGIDLGTTNSCVAIMEGSSPVVIQNSEGAKTTPSIVALHKEEWKVGMAAKRQAVTNPAQTVHSIKRFIGKQFSAEEELSKKMSYAVKKGDKNKCKVWLNNRAYSPEEISAKVLVEMKRVACDYLSIDSSKEALKAVITVPAYFNDAERQATKDAGKIAGLDVVRIINEPTAAALSYGLDKKDKNINVAVYDFGGGTFDISILECGGGVFEVKSTNGDVNLGGDNFDERVIDWLTKDFKVQQGIDLSSDPVAKQRLKEAVEKAKIELSSAQQTEINLPFISATQAGPKHLLVTLTRAKFEQLCDDLFRRSLVSCEKALESSGLKVEEIDEVVLVGGSTRIPRVQKEVEKFFKKIPNKSVNPDEVVAYGAAVQGGIIAGDVKGIVLLDVTPLSLGIETMGGVFTKLIDANTTIPTSRSEVFSTASDNQSSVDIKVFQGERSMAKDNKLLGQFHLDGIAPALRGKPQIEVTFDIDVNGIVSVSAKDKDTGNVQNIRIESSSSLGKEEIEKMKKDAEMHAEEDKQEREKIEKLNQADSMIFYMEKELRENGDKLDEEKKKKAEELIVSLKKAHDAKEMDRLEELMKEQTTLWQQIISDIMAAKQQEKKKKDEGDEGAKPSADVADAKFEDGKK